MSTPTPGDPLEPKPRGDGGPDPLPGEERTESLPGEGRTEPLPGEERTEPLPGEGRTEPAAAAAAGGSGTRGPRRLTRSREDRVLGGVAGGLGRYFDVDPVIFRIAFGASIFFGGIGFFAYLIALAFLPDERDGRAFSDRSRVLTIVGVILLGLAGIAVLDDAGWFFGPIAWFALLVGAGYAVYRAVKRTGGDPEVTAGRLITWAAIAAGAVVVLGILSVGAGWAAAEGLGEIVAGLLIALGAVLMVAAVTGHGRRARWLALPALAIAVPLGVVAAADVSFEGGYGDRTYRPATLADLPVDGYELGAGAMQVDLRDLKLPAGQETVLDLRLGMGAAEVLVAEDVCVEADAELGAGAIDVRGREAAGIDVDYLVRATAMSAPRLRLRADVGLGAVRVSTHEDGDGFDDFDDLRHDDGPFEHDDDDEHDPDNDAGLDLPDEDDEEGDSACTRVTQAEIG